MNDQLFEHAVHNWLDDGSDRTPPAAIDAVLLAVKTTPQERDLRIPRRFNLMPTYMRLAAAIAIVAILGVGAFAFINQGSGNRSGTVPTITPTVAPTPTASATPTSGPLTTEGWTPYVSERYGYSIEHPADWSETDSEHLWTWKDDVEAWQSAGVDSFINGQGLVRVSAWSAIVEPGSTVESVMERYCLGQNAGPCTGIQDGAVDVATKELVPGRLIFGVETDTMAFFLDGDIMYVVAVWRGETDPSVTRYGGARRLLEAFVSTLSFPAESPLETPAGT